MEAESISNYEYYDTGIIVKYNKSHKRSADKGKLKKVVAKNKRCSAAGIKQTPTRYEESGYGV